MRQDLFPFFAYHPTSRNNKRCEVPPLIKTSFQILLLLVLLSCLQDLDWIFGLVGRRAKVCAPYIKNTISPWLPESTNQDITSISILLHWIIGCGERPPLPLGKISGSFCTAPAVDIALLARWINSILISSCQYQTRLPILHAMAC